MPCPEVAATKLRARERVAVVHIPRESLMSTRLVEELVKFEVKPPANSVRFETLVAQRECRARDKGSTAPSTGKTKPTSKTIASEPITEKTIGSDKTKMV